MRFSKLFTFASITLGVASALVVPIRRDTTSDVDLELRDNHPNYHKVSFVSKATKHIKVLGLEGHDRQVVEDFHKNTVAAEMDKHGAHFADIHNLAHIEGSADPKMHITVAFRNPANEDILSKYGNPEKTGRKHHIYTLNLPKEYEQAVQHHKEHLENDPEAKRKHDERQAQSKAAKIATDKAREEKRKAEAEALKRKVAEAHMSGQAKAHELAGNAAAHKANRKANKDAKKAAKAAKAAESSKHHG
ncbi:hypothetical protein CPB84DRAFT_1828919 [Gymnopilus junonius]|uniref:Uncharacterized protein n=1 Tax=Gymnopilus junonius TaxID=109634 RepID=A0A9P5TH55_GYMJU|nr:hypothetical protein CPB84DRAFT_1828919 [Gymnopilus junonius]